MANARILDHGKVKAAGGSLTRTGTQTVDGISCGEGDIVFDTDAGATGGPWVAKGTTGVAWTRPPNWSPAHTEQGGSFWYIDQGTANGDKIARITTNGDITVDTTSVTSRVEEASATGVSGPASATDNAVARFDGTTGELVQDSSVLIDDSNNVSGVGTLAASGDVTVGTTTKVRAEGASTTGGVVLAEYTGNGTNTVTLAAPTSQGSDATVTFNADSDTTLSMGDRDIDLDLVFDRMGVAVVAFPDATGGGTTSAGTIQINDIAGNAVARAVVCTVMIDDLRYKGLGDASNATMATASTGSIVAGSGSSFLLIKTDASGAFAATITNASDETVYVSVSSSLGGVTAAGEGITIVESNSDDVTWSA